MDTQEKNELGTKPIGRLLFQLAAPPITAQIINLLYNLVDRIYIGKIEGYGRVALTGLGVALPVLMLITAFASLVGSGGAPRASIFLGKKDKESAEKTLGNCVTMMFFISIALTIIFSFFAEPMLLRFGADAETIPYALEYIQIYVLGTIFVQISLGLNMFITAQGFAKISMLTVLVGAITNIILDPIFIYGFNMGVKGAAWATIISQSLSAIWVMKFLLGKKTILKIKKEHLKLEAKIILPALALGLAPFIMTATESILNITFNTSLYKYGGNIAVGAMTILTSVMQFTMLPIQGFTQGMQPIVGYNYGAGNINRVKKSFIIGFIVCMSYTTFMWSLNMLCPHLFASLFASAKDKDLIEYTAWAIRIYMGMSCLMGAQIACQQTFVALGKAGSSLFLALLRKVILLIPAIYIMPMFFEDKAFAVFFAEPVSDCIAVTVTVSLFFFQFRKIAKGFEKTKKIV